jgi:hypothetical protein
VSVHKPRFVCPSFRQSLRWNPVFSIGSGYQITAFGHDKNKKQQFIDRLYLESVIITANLIKWQMKDIFE